VTFHGGTLEIQSQDGKGTTVVVRLPAEIPE
jgi:signal transduction histidine kinase